MGVEINLRKCYALTATMVVNSEVTKPVVTAIASRFRDETRTERSVSVLPRDVITPVFRQEELTAEQAHTPASFGNTDRQDSTMFVIVTGEEMGVELVEKWLWKP